jgi:cell division protein FtsB
VIRYEEKVPEELLALQAKNEALRKEIKKVSERYEAEKAEMEKLVPPSVIENMNKKISAVISNNEKVAEISKIIEEVTKENEKLAEETDKLEWGENNYLRDLENERRKQE